MAEKWRINGAKVAHIGFALSLVAGLIAVTSCTRPSVKVGSCYSDDPSGNLYSTVTKVHAVSSISSHLSSMVNHEEYVYKMGTAGLARHAYILEPSEPIWVKEANWHLSPKEFREDFEFEVPCMQFDMIEALVELHDHARLMENDVRRLMWKIGLEDAQ